MLKQLRYQSLVLGVHGVLRWYRHCKLLQRLHTFALLLVLPARLWARARALTVLLRELEPGRRALNLLHITRVVRPRLFTLRLIFKQVLVEERKMTLWLVIELLGHPGEVRLSGALLHQTPLIMLKMVMAERLSLGNPSHSILIQFLFGLAAVQRVLSLGCGSGQILDILVLLFLVAIDYLAKARHDKPLILVHLMLQSVPAVQLVLLGSTF